MLYTTFNKLLNNLGGEEEQTIQRIEKYLTGGRLAYGLDVPIYLVDILDHVSIASWAICMEHASEDTRDLMKNIAIAMIRDHMILWSSYTQGNDYLIKLMDYCDLYLTASTEANIRIGPCGKPIPGDGLTNWSALIDEQILKIEAYVEAFTSGAMEPSIVLRNWAVNGGPWTQAGVDAYQGTYRHILPEPMNVIEALELQDEVGELSTYVPDVAHPITDLLISDPDSWVRDSLAWDSVTIGGQSGWGMILENIVQSSVNALSHHGQLSAVACSKAAICVAYMVKANFHSMGSVNTSLRHAYMCFTVHARTQLHGMRIRAHSMLEAGGKWAFDTYTSSEISVIENRVSSAGMAKRASLCRDEAFIRSFDINNDDILSMSERQAMELAIHQQVLAVQYAEALTVVSEVDSEFIRLFSVDSEKYLRDSIRPYLL